MEGRGAIFVTLVEDGVKVEKLSFGPQKSLPEEGVNADGEYKGDCEGNQASNKEREEAADDG